MIPAIRNQQNLIQETKIKSLETQLANFQERFNTVINWINSQFFDLIGVPETVVLAIRGTPYGGHKSVGNIKRKNNISGSLKPSKPLRNQKSEVENVKEDSKCKRLQKLTIKTANEAKQEDNPANPMVKLDKLFLKDIPLLTDKYGVTNLLSIKTALSNISYEKSSCLRCCLVCNKNFKLRIHLEKHKLTCHPKNLTITNNKSSERKRRKQNLTTDINEESVTSLTPTSDEERDSGSEYDPLGDVISNDSCAEDILENIDEINVQNSQNLGVESEFIIKEEIIIKEEAIIHNNEEEDAYYSQVAKITKSIQPKEDKRAKLYYSKKNCGDISTQNKTTEQTGVGNKINLLEFEKLVKSQMEPRSSTCVVCSKRFSTVRKVTRHEMEVHLTNEDRKKYQIRKSSEQVKEKLKTYSFNCEICGRPFRNLDVLSRHRNTHVSSEVINELDGNGLRQYRCVNCNSVFSEKQKCINHVVRKCTRQEPELLLKRKKMEEVKHNKVKKRKCQNTKKSIRCETCGLMVGFYRLQKHMLTHTGEKNFVCQQCGQGFSRLDSLLRHELAIHKKEKNHQCQYCKKFFVLKFVKDAHEKKHLGVLTVSCHICGFTFTCMQNLKNHITGVHENQRPYKCDLCEKSFKSSTSLQYHVKTHSNPNGRKRGLNKEIDHLKAAAKRRHCQVLKNIRVPLLTDLVDYIATPAKK